MNYFSKRKLFLIFLSYSFLNFSNCSTFLVDLIEDGASDKAAQLLDKGANPNELGACDIPLYIAAKKGDKTILELLLKKGADVKLRSKECAYRDMFGRYKAGNRSALDSSKSVDEAKILLDAGADPRWGGFEERGGSVANWTPLYIAILAEKYDLAKLLVEKGARVNQYSDSDGSNIFLRLLNSKRDPKAQSLRYFIQGKGAKELSLAQAAKTNAGTQSLTTYKHIPTGNITTMSGEIISLLQRSPEHVLPLTLSATDERYYHYSEFEWIETKQNLHEWLILQKVILGRIKIKK